MLKWLRDKFIYQEEVFNPIFAKNQKFDPASGDTFSYVFCLDFMIDLSDLDIEGDEF